MHRRQFTGSLATLAAMGALGALVPWRGSRAEVDYPDGSGTLAERARAKGLLFGCAVKSDLLGQDQRYTELVAAQADIIVPEYELKREVPQVRPDGFNFTLADRIADFARVHGQSMRGHTLCWYAANPPWLETAMRNPSLPLVRKEKLLTDYIDAAVPRYAGTAIAWDVVNEPVAPDEGRSDGMRATNIWSEALGENYIDIAFHRAREKDPRARLYLNEFGIEADIAWNEAKRTAILKLLDRLKSRNVPIDGFGIQGHLKPYKASFNERIFRDFLQKLAGYGLRLSITEMDFMDRGGANDPAARDNEVAAVAKAFLDVALSFEQTEALLCWGITDRYSWLSSRWSSDRWPDGQFARGLPFSSDYREKKLYRAIGTALDSAPIRVPGR